VSFERSVEPEEKYVVLVTGRRTETIGEGWTITGEAETFPRVTQRQGKTCGQPGVTGIERKKKTKKVRSCKHLSRNKEEANCTGGHRKGKGIRCIPPGKRNNNRSDQKGKRE